MVGAANGSTVDFGGGVESGDVYGNDVTIVATSGTTGIQAMGNSDQVSAVSGDWIGIYGTGSAVFASGGTIDTVYSTSSVMLTGASDVVGAATGSTVDFAGTNAMVYGSGVTIAATAGGTSLTALGNSDTLNLSGANDTANLVGGGDVASAYGAKDLLSDTGSGSSNQLWLDGAGDTGNAYGAGDTVTGWTTGTNDVANLSGAGETGLLDGGGDVASANGANDVAELVGAGETGTLTGTGDIVSAYGANDVLTGSSSGSSDQLWLDGASDTGTAYGTADSVIDWSTGTNDAATLLGANETGTIDGAGESLTATGSGDTVTANGNLDIVTGGNGANVVLNGASDTAGTGSGSKVTINGNWGIVYGTQTTIQSDLQGGAAVVFGSGNTTDLNSSGQTVFDDGSGDTINGVNSGQTVDLGTPQGADTNVSVTVSGSGGTVNNVNVSDSVSLVANGTLAVNGSGGTIGLTGSGDRVIASNESLTTVSSVVNETVIGSGDSLTTGANASITVAGNNDAVSSIYSGDTLGFAGTSDTAQINSGTVYLDNASTSVTVLGNGDGVSSIYSGDTVGFAGTLDTARINNGLIYLDNGSTSATVIGNTDTVNSGFAGDTVGFQGTGETAQVNGGQIYLDSGSTSVTIEGSSDTVNSQYTGNVVGFTGTAETAQINNGLVYLDNASASVMVEGNTVTVNSQFSGNTVGFTGSNDIAQVSNGQIDTNTTSAGSLIVQGSGDSGTTISGTTESDPGLTEQTVSDIDAIDVAVLDRDAGSADLVSAQMVLANGGSMNSVMSAVANSAESLADMTSTYASAVPSTGLLQTLISAQPQSTVEPPGGGSAPTQTEFNGFADAMSTSYGGPIELYSVDPLTGAQTELADTSTTNLLAELPVLETQANGANLGLQLADGTQVQFANTGRLATWLYSVAVQQMQATQFVTDNYNLDMQWLSNVDQPLLDEADYWSERSAAEASSNKEASVEDNVQAHLALQIAAEAPGSRQDAEETIQNAATGNPTQISVWYSGDGSKIHDVATNVFGEILGAISTVVSAAALVTGNAYLYYAAAALDAANAGEDFSNGQDVAAILSTAAAISAGITGGAGGTPGTTLPPVSAQIINAAVQGVGGVYSVVQSAETGNWSGIFAGALEAAAAAASGIGMYEGGQTQAMLNSVATALGTIGLATSVGSAFASGNIALGLEDSLNLFLPALAQDYQQTEASITPGSISPDQISPTPDMLGTPQHLAFVGGFFDYTESLLFGNQVQTTYNEYLAYLKAAPAGSDVRYFSWDDASDLTAWGNQVNANNGSITLIGHSYGAATAASVVAAGLKVQTLVTLDPVSYLQPDFKQVAANIENGGQWLNLVAAGGGLTLPNAIAGIGSAWNDATVGYATTINVSTDHGGIESATVYNKLLGISVH